MNSELLPDWVVWSPRSFPDTNLLLLAGGWPALIDSGFVGHADQTPAWVRSHTAALDLVVNTHWHADHVGGNALLQTAGVRVAASAIDAAALSRPDPACCLAEYLDQPVAPLRRRRVAGRRAGPTARERPVAGRRQSRVTPRATCRCGSPTNGC